MSFVLIPLALGFLGSFHCVGMCGPIALALPIGRRSTGNKIIGILLYNFGRVLTYGLLGLLFGAIGRGFSIAGLQQAISIILGVSIIAIVLLLISWMHSQSISHTYLPSKEISAHYLNKGPLRHLAP